MLEESGSRIVTTRYYRPTIAKGSEYAKLLIAGCGELVFKHWNP